MKNLLTILFVLFSFAATAQNIGIGTNAPNASALLDITATNKGLLIPRMNTAAVTAIPNPAKGLMVLDTAKNQLMFNIGTPALPNWQTVTFNSGWGLNGNAAANTATNFIGTTDNVALNFRVNNIHAGAIDPIKFNTFLGLEAGNVSLTGERNVAIGYNSLRLNGVGEKNIAVGSQALRLNSSGSDNTVVGYDAMFFNENGSRNTAFGENALNKTLADENVGIGFRALEQNISGSFNTALGYQSGNINTGSGNIFMGYNAGANETGDNKLYISNSNANANNALVYGEFDNKILSIGGKLGIGTTTPENLLHLKDANTNANASQMIIEGNSNFGNTTTAAIEFRSNFSSGNSGPSGRIVSYYTSNIYTDAKTTFQTVGPGPVFIDAMTLTNGKVGIGTTTPNGELHLSPTLANRKIVLYEDANNDHQFNGFGINAFIMRYQAAATNSSHVFYAGTSATTSIELMRVTGNGIVGIGNVPLTSIDDSRLQIKQKGSQNGIGVIAENSNNHWDFYTTTSVTSNFNLYYNGAYKGTFDNVTGAYTAASDRRLKKDITPYQPVLNNVMQLQAYQYHYLDNKTSDRFSNGFMAQDVQKIFPNAVIENTMKDGETRLGINYQYFTVLAIKGLQEQHQTISSQEDRIAKLEALVKTLIDKK